MQGVNHELMPLLRMTAPAEMQHQSFTRMPLNETVFSSWLLLFSVIPFDRHYLQFERVSDSGFSENSYSWLHRLWRHERSIMPTEDGCTLTDTVTFEPRLPFMGYLLLPIVRRAFEHRHQHLRQHFGVTI